MNDVTWQIVTATSRTDNVGSPAYNEALAKRRAAAVRDDRVGQGLPPPQLPLLRTAPKGEAAPVADTTTQEGRAQNGRAEVLFKGVRAALRWLQPINRLSAPVPSSAPRPLPPAAAPSVAPHRPSGVARLA